MARQSTIQHHTFEYLSLFADGFEHWTPDIAQRRSLARRGFLHINGEGFAQITMLGRRVLAEYRERHAVTPS